MRPGPCEPIRSSRLPTRPGSTRAEVLAEPSPVPRQLGVYGWYFSRLPDSVPTAGCVMSGSCTLLYVGIAPKNRHKPSSETLWNRIRNHMNGNAEGSTLRLTLGCLLGLELRRVGSGDRKTFAAREAQLSEWMEENAFVCWASCAEPRLVEEQLIATVSLPLNLDQNRSHAFHKPLTELRANARLRAHDLPCV